MAMTAIASCVCLLALAAPGSALSASAVAQAPSKPAVPASSGAPAAGVQSSTKTAGAMTPADLYTGDRLRDPFMDIGAGGGGRGAAVSEQEPFNIHALALRGLMEDKTGDFAILVQPTAGATYILKNGKLYDRKNKVVPGVTGSIKLKQKTVHIMTSDKDVQTLILGEQQEGI